MFTTSDKVILGLCGALTATGIVMIHKGLKGLKELREQEEILIDLKKEVKRKEGIVIDIGRQMRDDLIPMLEKAEAE